MRHRIFALALGLFAITTSAAWPGVNPNLLPHAPNATMNVRRALAVQRLLHLQTTPTLGAQIWLSPSTPYIPGMGELDFGGASYYISGSLTGADVIPYVAVEFKAYGTFGAGWIKLTISGRAGSHYAIDCMASSGPNPVQYTITGPVRAEGSVNVEADQHFIIATQSLPANGNLSVLMLEDVPAPVMNFYGCDVSPF